MNDFAALGLRPDLCARLAERRISAPTEIQRLSIPALLEGRSAMFRSATGTGKTFAYLLPALQRILAKRDAGQDDSGRQGPELLVVAPTLELCAQIKAEIDFLLEGSGLPACALLIGSTDMARQIDGLKRNKPVAAVGNPRRLLALADMRRLSFRALEFVALDEADRLAAPECAEESARLVGAIARAAGAPTVCACSATVSARTSAALKPLLDGATLLETDEREILRDRIAHWAIFSESRRKARTLASLLAAIRPKKALIFAERAYDAGKIVALLRARGIAASGLFSDMSKGERRAALDLFRCGKSRALVASDLAARGLDVPDVTHVIALGLSEDPDAYVHRAGRTGRAGKKGIMVCIGDERDMRRLSALEKKLGIAVHPKELYGGRLLAPDVIDTMDTIDSDSDEEE
ncbi:MAG: DEAD/DEAH box helicase, partial [Treponema sp.]|nr:DEAD/DEAH box helicase [Treponema sp.]